MATSIRPHGWGDLDGDASAPAFLPPAESIQSAVSAMAVGAAAPPLPAMALYLTERGDTTAISVNDLHQGQLGDCFLIAAIGELAIKHPTAISNMIHVNSNGTETVTLYGNAAGRVASFGTTVFKPVAVTVTNVFPTNAINNGSGQSVLGTQKEIWPQVIEKAVATMDGGYTAIANGGSPVIAMQQLTGHAATYMSPSALTQASLQSLSNSGDLVVMDTFARSGLAYNLVGGHAYMFEGMTTVNGAAMVQLGNPWGFNQPSLIPLSQLGKVIAEVDVGHFT